MKKDVSGDAFRANVTDIVFELMRDSILDGTWKVGEKIPSENKLTAVYGVSRVTVRAAIARLSSLGMLESRQGGGMACGFLAREQVLYSVDVLYLPGQAEQAMETLVTALNGI